MKLQKAVLVTLLGLALAVTQSYGTTMFDPGLKWRSLETPNFSIHYHQGEEELAQEAGRIAEDVHEKLSPLMKWKPFTKTQMILTDNVDFANGWATPFPYNTVCLYLTHPAGAELDPCEDWLRELITHEYTHILHMDQVHGAWKVLRYLFGRIVLPNAVGQPIWLIEGFAVHNESNHTAGGRQRGAVYDMMLRVATLEGKLNSLDQAAAFIPTWPLGGPYLYGGMFYRWLADEYGEEKLVQVSHLHSGTIPFLIDLPAVVVYGKPWFTLWEEWVSYLKERYERQREEIESKPLTISKPLTSRGYKTSAPAFSPDERSLAYVVEYGIDEYPSLRLMDVDRPNASAKPGLLENHIPILRSIWRSRTGDRVLVKAPVNPGLSFSPDGETVLFSQRESYKNYYTYDDLYSLNLRTGKKRRLTKGLRARDPDWSPDGDRILFVVNKLGRKDLVLMSLSDRQLRYLTHNEEHIQYSLPRFSPDGEYVAVSRWKPGPYQDICLIDLAKTRPGQKVRPTPILEDRAVDLAPSWSPDGKWILFSSDRSGVYNIYAYSPLEKKLYQVTNVLGGAFYPAVSPDGKSIAFSSYGVNGYDIHLVEFDPQDWWESEPYVDRLPNPDRKVGKATYPTRFYNPIPTLLPRFWVPLPSWDEKGFAPGFITLGWDALQQHQYQLLASWGIESKRPSFQFSYLNNMRWPEIALYGSDLATSMTLTSQSLVDTTYWEKSQTGGVEVYLPFMKTSSGQSISVGYEMERLSALSQLPSDVTRPDTGILSGVSLSWLYGNSKWYFFGISPTEGRLIRLGIEREDKRLYGDFDMTKVFLDWREYLPVPLLKHNVLAARLAGAISLGDQLTQRSFQLGGATGDYFLRGYPEGTFSGQKVVSGSLEYRFPLLWAHRGCLTIPFFLSNFQGNLFSDFGHAWDADEIPALGDFRLGVGGEVGTEFDLGFGFLPFLIKIGFAMGLNEEGGPDTYLSVGSSF